MKNPILSVQNLNLKFRVYNYRNLSLKELASNLLNKRIDKGFKEIHALKDINFDLYEGDRLGIVGKNGSGKSTLLKTICKIYQPSSGNILSNLKITPLLEAGAAFNPEFTGRENIFLNGAIYGISRKQIKRNIEKIIKFAELENFIDVPVKNYSTGMYTRLAFAAATAFDPEFLIMDEVFLGGDYKFLKKGQKRLNEFIDSAKGMILVSHDSNLLKNLCNRFIWIENGCLIDTGNYSVVEKYENS